jgi:hypothetical protein
MEFKKIKEPIQSDDFWYDLTSGGYIKPEKLLKNKEDVAKVKEAIKIIQQFQQEAEENEVIIPS